MLSQLVAFGRLSRLKFLAGGFAGGAFGTAMAVGLTGRFDGRAYAIAQGTIVAFHLMTHYANDYFDRDCDARSQRTPYSGGSGALVDGSLDPRVGLRAAYVCAIAGLAGTFALASTLHATAAALVALAMALGAWTYSAPPIRLLARGLGECDTALVVAIFVPLCAYAAQGAPLELRAVASTLPGAAAMIAMMIAVEYPDIEADAIGGKRNLVVRFGTGFARTFGSSCAFAVYGLVGLALFVGAPPLFGFFEIATVPLALGLAAALHGQRTVDRDGNEAIAARGVAFFFVVTFFAFLAYAAPLRQF